MRTIAAAIAGYLIGTIPSADIAARAASRRRGPADLREVGTGNPGALNAAKTLGWEWGALVLAGDLGKGVVASIGGRRRERRLRGRCRRRHRPLSVRLERISWRQRHRDRRRHLPRLLPSLCAR